MEASEVRINVGGEKRLNISNIPYGVPCELHFSLDFALWAVERHSMFLGKKMT